MSEDLLETRLRRALNTEASMVNPSGDGLGRIRAGIAEEQQSIWWRRPALALVAAAFLGLAVGGVAVALSQNDDGGPNGIAGTTTVPQTTAPTTEPAPTTSPSNTLPTSNKRTALYVYYLHDDGSDVRLYREQHSVPVKDVPFAALALEEMLYTPAQDPDYSSPWKGAAQLRGYTKSGDTATVSLSGFVSVGSDADPKAVQQLVYTVTANDTSVKKVRLLVNGKAPQSGHSDWSQPVARAPMLDVQGLIWILAPSQGSKVGSPVKVTVYGTAYEGNVIIKVFNGPSFDQEVASTFVTTEMGAFREASTTIQLDPGTYTVRAYDGNGENGELTERDSKQFTVK